MKSGTMLSQIARASLALVVLAGTAQAGVTNQVWRRATDWVPGTSQGTSSNNPSPVQGQAVWSYEWTNGDGLASEDPWYKNAGHLMTWDGAWWGTGWGVWSKGDDHSPPILPGRLIHNVASSEFANIPMVRWENPMGNGGSVNIAGTLLVNWNGVNGLGRPDDVDVVIAKFTASTNTTVALFSNTVSKPNPFPSVGDSVLLPINLSNITVNQGDSIIISHRGQQGLAPLGAWINLYDGLTFTAVPTPGTAGLLGAAGLMAFRRRRR